MELACPLSFDFSLKMASFAPFSLSNSSNLVSEPGLASVLPFPELCLFIFEFTLLCLIPEPRVVYQRWRSSVSDSMSSDGVILLISGCLIGSLINSCSDSR